jgi:hypothetical protein
MWKKMQNVDFSTPRGNIDFSTSCGIVIEHLWFYFPEEEVLTPAGGFPIIIKTCCAAKEDGLAPGVTKPPQC